MTSNRLSFHSKNEYLNCRSRVLCYTDAENWTMSQGKRRKLKSFELQSYRRMMKISWVERVNKDEVLARIQESEITLLKYITKRRDTLIGHIPIHVGIMNRILEEKK